MKIIIRLFLSLNVIFFLSPNIVHAQGCIDAAIYNNSTGGFFFRGDEVSLGFNFDALDINSEFGGNLNWASGTGHIDAAFRLGNEFIYFISGDQFAVIDPTTKQVITAPAYLSGYFDFLPSEFEEGIDAAFAFDLNSSVYMVFFFKGNQWINFTFNISSGEVTYENTGTGEGFAGVLSTHFTEGVDAAMYFPGSEKIAFFSGDQFILYDGPSGSIDPGSPGLIVSNWQGFPSQWSCVESVDNGACDINYNLPDHGCAESAYLPIDVSTSIGTSLGNDVQVSSVSIFIEHTFVGDLVITLISPSGKECWLAQNLGENGDNYGASCSEPTVFTDNGPTIIGLGEAPFVGEFIPILSLEGVFDDGSNPSGTWYLKVCDGVNQDLGTIQFVDIQFETPVSTKEIEGLTSMTVQPNPTSGLVTLNLELERSMTVQLGLYDMVGRLIKRFPAKDLQTYEAQIDLSDQADGWYLAKVMLDNQVVTKRIMKGR